MKSYLFLLLFLGSVAHAQIVRYELTARIKPVNLSGKETVNFAIAVNDQIPAPTLTFVEGDEAEIVVKNEIPDQELSLHWHGLLLPNEMDGVSYVTTPPIMPGESYTFRFPLRQNGTYWYHSHTMVQEQKGVYGAFVVKPKSKPFSYDKEVVAVLSDWSDENADSILSNLKKDGDYYLYKKGTMRSWWGAIAAGKLGNFLYNEWTRMGGMDYSDVGYDAFLINGKQDSQLLSTKPGEKTRVRIINAGSSSYFYVAMGGGPMKVVSADGIDIEPTKANEILMGMAETYDILVEPKEKKNYELRITVQDGTGTASAWIGDGEKVAAPVKPFPDMYATMDHSSHEGHSEHGGQQEHSGHSEHHGHHGHHSAPETKTVETMSVDQITATKSTVLPKAKVNDLKLVLGGDMRRYIWHMNGKAIQQDRNIEVKENEVFRFTFENQTMMHHPMHLHGHFFRVVTDKGELSPLKHTVDVPPHSSRVIEFYTNEPGDWMLHCHNLYHMHSGMARVVKYISFKPKAEIAHLGHHDPHMHEHTYFYGMVEAATNHAQANFRVMQTWSEVEARVEGRNSVGNFVSFDQEWEIEGDLFYRRWFDQYFNVVGGLTYFNGNPRATAGVWYMLPMLIEAQVLVDHQLQFRFDLEKRFQWTKTIYSDVEITWRPAQSGNIESEFEYEVSLMYSPVWSWSAGLMLTDHGPGAGLHVQF